ncbi:MAG: amidohydrolase family protein [Acidobacteriota bacterium]|nr:amidohydrolase family protein [Acidobacteriota bacterium]
MGRDIANDQTVAVEFETDIASVRIDDEERIETLCLSPGFIDLQVNGFAGVDFNDPTASIEDIGIALNAMFATGVTRCLPTVITGPPDAMLASLRNLRRAQKELKFGRAIAGFHVEGPHIGPEDGPRGAHPMEWVRPPVIAEFRQWQDATEGNVRLVTLSPHWPGAAEYIASVVKAGVAVSIGHTGASSDQIAAAVDAGATLSTHLGNAAYKNLPKFPNCLWDQLANDKLHASFILDGWHLDSAFLRVALRAKSIERTILVTDAAAPAGAAPGQYKLGALDVELTDDERVVLRGSRKLAGSALRMNRALANLVRLGGTSLRDAVQTATVNPARLIGLEGRTRGLVPGERGDVVVFREPELAIEAVYLDGVRVA